MQSRTFKTKNKCKYWHSCLQVFQPACFRTLRSEFFFFSQQPITSLHHKHLLLIEITWANQVSLHNYIQLLFFVSSWKSTRGEAIWTKSETSCSDETQDLKKRRRRIWMKVRRQGCFRNSASSIFVIWAQFHLPTISKESVACRSWEFCGSVKHVLWVSREWPRNLALAVAVAVAVATNLDMAYLYSKNNINCLLVWP